ncbi:MAG: serine/threonine-protein kinase [Planctomycetota bacterium]
MRIDSGVTSTIRRPAGQSTLPIPGYRILSELGRGGMGVVYRALHLGLEREVALKVLAPGAQLDPEAVARFRRESRTLAALDHPHLVRAYDAGVAGGLIYLALELVDGEDLKCVLERRGTFPAQEALEVVLAVARGLAHAYASPERIIHRDVKPSNVLCAAGPGGRLEVKVTDFGLARPSDAGSTCTELGAILGTPSYMPPEQALGETLDLRADVYALGATLYELLTGRPPYQGRALGVITRRIQGERFPAPSQLGIEVPAGVERVLDRMLASDRDARYADYGALISDLEALLAGKRPRCGRVPAEHSSLVFAAPRRARPLDPRLPGRLLAAGALVVGFAGVAYAALPAAPRETAAVAPPAPTERRGTVPQRRVGQPLAQTVAPTVDRASVRALLGAFRERTQSTVKYRVRLSSEVPGARLVLDGAPAPLPYDALLLQDRTLECEVSAPGHAPLRRRLRVDRPLEVTLDPTPLPGRELQVLREVPLFEPPTPGEVPPGSSSGWIYVLAPNADGVREVSEFAVLPFSSPQGAEFTLPLAQRVTALAGGAPPRGWRVELGLEFVKGAHATWELSTLTALDGRQLCVRVQGARLELGTRWGSEHYRVALAQDLEQAPAGLRVEWNGETLSVATREAEGAFAPALSLAPSWEPVPDYGATLAFRDFGDSPASSHASMRRPRLALLGE